jgi:hypothetical protein
VKEGFTGGGGGLGPFPHPVITHPVITHLVTHLGVSSAPSAVKLALLAVSAIRYGLSLGTTTEPAAAWRNDDGARDGAVWCWYASMLANSRRSSRCAHSWMPAAAWRRLSSETKSHH